MPEAEFDASYEEGASCARSGGSVKSNPYGNADSAQFLAWHRGWIEHRTADPKCEHCGGFGWLDASQQDPDADKKIGVARLHCFCNVGSESET